jgi:hypothetical protein
MLNYKNFKEELLLEKLINESVIYFSPEFIKILKKRKLVDNEIARSILDIEMKDIKPDISFVDLSDKEGYITFNTMKNALNKIKAEEYEHIEYIKDEPDQFDRERRRLLIRDIYNHRVLSDIFTKSTNPLRIGKFINKLFPGKFSETEREEFVNLFKSSLLKLEERFEIVEGDDISFWYQGENYAEISGQLGSSCMRNMRPETFEIYTENPEVCRMLILLDSDDSLLGRSLIWKCSIINGDIPIEGDVYFMDRQYTIKESDVYKFRDYADENGWIYKTNNNHHSFGEVTYHKKVYSVDLRVDIKGVPDRFPYMDTFRRLDPSDKSLFNNDEKEEDNYILDSTSGSYTEIENGVWSDWHDRRISEEDAVWSDWADSYLERDSATNVYHGSRRNQGWYPDDCGDLVYDEWSDISIHIDDSVYSEEYGYSIFSNNAVQVIDSIDSDGEPRGADSNWYHEDDTNVLYIGGLSRMAWHRRLSNEWNKWDDYSYALLSLFIDNYKGEKIIKMFAITSYRVVDSKESSIDIESITEYLTELDAKLLGHSIDKSNSRVVDKFEYYEEIEELIPKLSSIAISEWKKIKEELKGSQLKISFEEGDEDKYREALENKLEDIEEKISDIDDGVFIDSPS